MTRFLEFGRVIDAFTFFTVAEISENLHKLNLPKHALKKWRRMMEVYAPDNKMENARKALSELRKDSFVGDVVSPIESEWKVME